MYTDVHINYIQSVYSTSKPDRITRKQQLQSAIKVALLCGWSTWAGLPCNLCDNAPIALCRRPHSTLPALYVCVETV